MDDALAYFRSNIPRCLERFRTGITGVPETAGGGHGEPYNTHFGIICPDCGAKIHSVIGHKSTIEEFGESLTIYTNPLSLRCLQCGYAAVAFDSTQHGYDAEACDFRWQNDDPGPMEDAACSCAATAFEPVICQFSYTDDLFEMDEVIAGGLKAENLFTWFKIIGKCKSCGKVQLIAEHECA